MFSSLFAPLAPEPDANKAEGDGEAPAEEQTGQPSGAAPILGLDIWGLANAVSNTVKAQTQEIVKSVAQTDWKSELMAFSKEAAEEGKQISHKTAEVVEHLPQVVERLPQQAERLIQGHGGSGAPSVPDVSAGLTQVSGSLRTLGNNLFAGTKEIIEQVRDAVEGEIAQAAKDARRQAKAQRAGAAGGASGAGGSGRQLSAGTTTKYNRFEADVASMQRDSSTYCDEPSDTEDYTRWKGTFSLDAAKPQIDAILADNSFMSELHARIVPAIVEPQDFWLRYFYRLHKLQAREEARQALTQRAKAMAAGGLPAEEEIGWDDLEPSPSSPTQAKTASPSAPEASKASAAAPAKDDSSTAGTASPGKAADVPAAASGKSKEGLTPESDAETGKADTAPTLPTSIPPTTHTDTPTAPAATSQAGSDSAASGVTGRKSDKSDTQVSVSASVIDGSPKASDVVSMGDDTHSDGGGSKGEWCVVSGAASNDEPARPAAAAAVAAAGSSGSGTGAMFTAEAAAAAALSGLSVLSGPSAAPRAPAAATSPAADKAKSAAPAAAAATGSPVAAKAVAPAAAPAAATKEGAGGDGEDEDDAWGDWD